MFSPRFVVKLLDKPQVLPESLKKLQLFGLFDDFLQYIYVYIVRQKFDFKHGTIKTLPRLGMSFDKSHPTK